jgi:dipeptidyl-peptidase-3
MKAIRNLLLIPTLCVSTLLAVPPKTDNEPVSEFQVAAERFSDIQILRYRVPGFEQLPLQQKELLYYLYEASLAGRDITWDQNFSFNLTVRRALEEIVTNYSGDRTGETWEAFMTYTKRVWFSNGIHHHYSTAKIEPEFTKEYFLTLLSDLFPDESRSNVMRNNVICDVVCNPMVAPRRVNKTIGVDPIAESACNFYENVTEAEVDTFYAKMKQTDEDPMWGLNSKLCKDPSSGELYEKVWKIDGMYGSAIKQIVYWMEKAVSVAENDKQREALQRLIVFYKTGDLADFDSFNISWVQDVESSVDMINGFIERYGDPKGLKGTYESIVSVRDPIASKRIETISSNAQWFEEHSPIRDEHKRENVTGISAKVINVVIESGDAAPSTPIGVNLPNSNWIRSKHGSKSVTLGNIIGAYGEASKGNGVVDEFYLGAGTIARIKGDGGRSHNLEVDMHEVIGHASGKLNPGVGTPSETLGQYMSTLEEARADLVALYFIMDQKLIDIGVMESFDIAKAGYDTYLTSGLLLQLKRINLGDNIEEAHMRNRQLICKWAVELGSDESVVEQVKEEGKTFYVINDYLKLREIFGSQLREIQRIKSEGDGAAGARLVETYGIHVDPALHQEVLERYETLDIAPYSGFINPELIPQFEKGTIVDVAILYPEDFTTQMLKYSKEHSFLPAIN